MDHYIGKMLDNRYEILECIGTGGMAIVYKARCHRLNRLVAVKILKPDLARDADFRRRFHDESQAVAMLSHTNIVAVYDVSHSDGLDYIVMELVDGLTLKQYMRKRGTQMGWREALHFITQIIRALSHAHSRGIIHRDIKPQNIMVLRDGSVKVTDFGIARMASAAQSTLTQEALGSVHYISPEQARGSHIDGRSDIYSAGVVLYEMLTGRLPFEGETPVSVAIQHINSIPIPPRDLNDSIPPALEAIVLKAMAPKTENRYASADEMLSDLEEFRKNPDAIPTHAQREDADESAMDDATRVVPVAEIKEEQQRVMPRQAQEEEPAGEEKKEEPEGPDILPQVQPKPRPAVRKPAEPEPEPKPRPEPRRRREDDYEDEEPEPPQRGTIIPYIIAVLAILVFAGGMLYFVYDLFFNQVHTTPTSVIVPTLTDYTWEQLESNRTLYSGFTLLPQYEVNDAPAGTVLRQDPAGGVRLTAAEQKLITLVISSGVEPPLEIPSLTGKTWTEAAYILREMELYPVSENEHSTVQVDYVIRTNPQAGSSVQKGDTITVFVSIGEAKVLVPVPDFKGWNIDDACRLAEQVGLQVVKIVPVESENTPNTVVWQSLIAYSEVPTDSELELWISQIKEPEPTDEPTASPDIPPDVDPGVSESPDVQPINTAAVAVTKSIGVDLTSYADKESVRLKIVVGGKVVEDKNIAPASFAYYTTQVSSIGEQFIEIYVDDDLVNSYTEQFT